LGHTRTQAISDGGISLAYVVTEVIGKKYTAVFRFDSEDDRGKAIGLIKKGATSEKVISQEH